MTHTAQSRDSDFRARQPGYRLGDPGDVVVHAGPRQQPRIVSVPTRHAEHLIDLVEGDDLFDEITGLLDSLDVSGLMVEFVNGEFGGVKYVYPAYGPDAEHPMSFTTESRVEGPAGVHHGSATVGTKDDVPFTHIHASWVAEDGTVSGGHLLAGTLVGPNGMRLRTFALTDAQLLSEIDPESGFSAFAPAPLGAPLATEAESSGAPTASGSAAETDSTVGVAPVEAASAVGVPPSEADSAVSPATAVAVPDHSVDAVVSRVRPGESIDEAILAVCREAGFDSAEVRASLGSTTGAVFTEATAPWPAVEFTHLTGTVNCALGGNPQVRLEGEVVDVAGNVHSGVLADRANPVAVTFELFVRQA